MKSRVLSLLLALSMVFSMLSMVSVPAAAAGTTLTAYQTEKNRAVSVDGVINEPQWIADTPVGDGSYLGALCDATTLYFALDTAASVASLSVNNQKIDVNLGSAPSTSMGTVAGGNGIYELALPLAQLGISFETGVGTTVPMSLNLNTGKASYDLAIGTMGMVMAEGGKVGTAEAFNANRRIDTNSTDELTMNEDNAIVFNYSGDAYRYSYCNKSVFNAVGNQGFMLSFEADFIEVAQRDASKPSKNPAQTCLFFYMCNGTNRYDMSFWTDEDNQLMFSALSGNAARTLSASIPTGLTPGTDEANNVKVRIFADPEGNVHLYMNGELLGTVKNARYAATTGGQFRFFADHRFATPGKQNTNVVFRDYFYREYVPGQLEVKNYDGTAQFDPKSGSGENNATAFLDLGTISVDGDISDAAWHMPNAVAYRVGNDAPAAHVGFLWDAKNLYIGIQTYSKNPMATAQFAVGEKNFTADLAANSASVGELIGSFQQYEWAIPLSELGLTSALDAVVDYVLTVNNQSGTSGMQGKLTFDGRTVVLADSCDDMTSSGHYFEQLPNTTISQDDGYYAFNTDPAFTNGNEIAYIRRWLPHYDELGYEIEFDVTIHDLPYYTATRGWRGWAIEIYRINDGSYKYSDRFNLLTDGSDKVVMDVLYADGKWISADTGIKLGERAKFKVVVTDDHIPTLYVNGEYVFTYPAISRQDYTPLEDNRIRVQAINHNRAKSNDGTIHVVDVDLHDLLWTQTKFATPEARLNSALSNLTDEVILAGNKADDLKTNLNLPATVAASEVAVNYPVTWTLTDANTGAKLNCINLTTGQITGGKAVSLVLTATVSEDDVTVSKSFKFAIKGSAANGKIAFIERDANPMVGVAKSFTRDEYVYLDGDSHSVVYDQGSAKRFNRIVLHDGDNFSRASHNDFGVYISNDNKSYTKVNGWQLHQDGSVYTLYNLDQTARYVKVHSFQNSMDTTETQPSFYNTVQAMMAVSYTEDLLGAKGAFAKSAELTVAGEGEDVPVYLSIEKIGAKAGEYQVTCADFRFTQGSVQLPHWYDGKGGFYVRVPAISGSAKVTAHWGNASAKDISDGEATFEAVYGNVTTYNITDLTALDDDGVALTKLNQQDPAALGSARSFTFPDGTVIVMGNSDKYNQAYIRSTDGGRTFSPIIPLVDKNDPSEARYGNRGVAVGAFLWDEEYNNGKGRLWMLGYSSVGQKTGDKREHSDCRMVIIYSDDRGETWNVKDRQYLTVPGVDPIADNDLYYSNSTAELRRYMLSYSDGIKLKDADGDGPNVDYVVSLGIEINEDTGSLGAGTIYSTDCGKTWYQSENIITMEANKEGHEYGISETGIVQMEDGSLYIICRAQSDDNDYLYETYSYDCGKTWTQAKPSPVISTNTQPLLAHYDDVGILVWPGHNSLGGNARQRLPLSLGVSSDGFKTYDKFINLTLGSSLDTIKDDVRRITNHSNLYPTADGNEVFMCWTDLRGRPYNKGGTFAYYRETEGIFIEEFRDMIFKTKGAYDDFETTTLHSEGWLADVSQDVTLALDKSATGDRSMKVTDSNNVSVYATRYIPSIHGGNVGASIYVPSGNTTDFAFELKAAYNYTYLKHTIAAFGITPTGDVFVGYDSGNQIVGKVKLNSWNDFAISFDMDSGEKGTLYVNGKAVSRIELTDKGTEVSAVQISAPVHSADIGSHIYVDNFYVTEAAVTQGPARNTFTDVAKDAWYAEAVSFALDNRIMGGYNATTFGPNDTLSRAMVVQVLYNKEGQPAISGKHKFPDVAASQWYNNAITWASQNGVVGGYGDGRFGPNDNVTLEQAAVILWNYSGNPAATGSLDAIGTHSDWAANALRWCAAEGLLEGIPFDAVTGAATRAQTAHLLMNYLNK